MLLARLTPFDQYFSATTLFIIYPGIGGTSILKSGFIVDKGDFQCSRDSGLQVHDERQAISGRVE
jgi:hypothetical protein